MNQREVRQSGNLELLRLALLRCGLLLGFLTDDLLDVMILEVPNELQEVLVFALEIDHNDVEELFAAQVLIPFLLLEDAVGGILLLLDPRDLLEGHDSERLVWIGIVRVL